MIKLKSGQRLKSAVCDTEIMIIKAPPEALDLRCGGVAMRDMDAQAVDAERLPAKEGEGCQVGKRYVDASESLELLCTKGGAGSLSVNGVALGPRASKALPSSD